MKVVRFFAAAICAATALYSCSTEPQAFYESPVQQQDVIITASLAEGPATKTIRQEDGKVFWSPGDEISLFYGSGTDGGSKFTSQNDEPAQLVHFSGSIGAITGGMEMSAEDTYFWGLYPYDADASCDGYSVTTTLSAQQTGVAGTFEDDTFITLGRSQGLNLGFYNVCGGIKFSVSQAGIKSITFRGNNGEALGGKVKIAFGEDGKPYVAEVQEPQTEMTLVAPDGEFEVGAYYHLVTLPATLSNGFTMEFIKSGEKGTRTTTSSTTINRGKFGTMTNADTKATFVSVVDFEYVDLGLTSGVKWATFNLGATKPEEYGDYYAWGETEPYYVDGDAQKASPTWKSGKSAGYDWSSYSLCNGSGTTLTKYCSSTSFGTVDDKTVLEPDDDAAHVKLGDLWRMPTDDEWYELLTDCSWSDWIADYNGTGVAGRLVTSTTNGNSIFIPAAGYRRETDLNSEGALCYYCSSSLYEDYPCYSYGVYFNSSNRSRSTAYRYDGLSVRPVYGAVPVSEVSLKSSMLLYEGESETLMASFLPGNATNRGVTWNSSDTSVATVDANGKVAAVAPGTATVTVTTADGNKTATCTVTVNQAGVWAYVDLGLTSGVKWATFNLGATKPSEYGDYYAWGETEPHYVDGDAQKASPTWKSGKTGYDWSSYSLCNGSAKMLTKYCSSTSYGTVDSKIVLEPDDDAAHVKLGGSWRMPTDAECNELLTECSWSDWIADYNGTGVAGYTVTGTNGNSIFLPAAGYRYESNLGNAGSYGSYLSSSLHSSLSCYAYSLYFYSDYVYHSTYERYYGRSVRPVYGAVPVSEVSLNKSSMSLYEGESETLSVSFLPGNATNRSVTWNSSDTSVATVDADGKVSAVAPGTATVTVTTADGNKTATCAVTVNQAGVLAYVDLGLTSGLKWATFNVGATKPSEYGDYYA